jgi:N-carbamoyl-L-amino-acid hydrolase
MDIEPNSSNVIAERVTLYAEMRATDNGMLVQACADFERAAAAAAALTQTQVALQQVTNRPAGRFDAGLCELIEGVALAQGRVTRRLSTVAGHDAVSLRSRCPTAMIFVPSQDGISHNETEFTQSADLEAGLQVLAGVLQSLVCAPVKPTVV